MSGGAGGITEPGPYIVRRNLFALNESPSGYGTIFWDRVSGVFEQNTLVGNGTHGLILDYDPQHEVTIRQNIFASTVGAVAVWFTSSESPQPISACNDFWNNPGGNTAGYSPDATDLVVDPKFCDEAGGNYTLAGTSPCLPPNSGACGLIGAFGQGCNGVAIEAETWARTKQKFRIDRQAPPSASAR